MSVLTLSISISDSKANEIYITQAGDGLVMDIEQDGEDHVIKPKTITSKIDGDDVTFIVRQNKHNNVLEYDQITGDNNQIGIFQGENIYGWESSSTQGNNNFVGINVEGNNNSVEHQQLNNWHDVNTNIQGDGNNVRTNQQNWGAKSIDLTINNDDNNVDIDQRGGGETANHTATITLDGTYGTNLDLNQSGTTQNSYTLSQNCMTVGGCSVTVTQN